jgi:hypothetical protein
MANLLVSHEDHLPKTAATELGLRIKRGDVTIY